MAVRAPIAAKVEDDVPMTGGRAGERRGQIGLGSLRAGIDIGRSRASRRPGDQRDENEHYQDGRRHGPRGYFAHADDYPKITGGSREAAPAAQARARRASRTAIGMSVFFCAVVHAAGADELRWKLTVGEYAYADYAGTDANLRWRHDGTDAWAGIYDDRVFGSQARMGADTIVNVAPYLQVQPSLQLATQGFVGGSVNLQVGAAWYGVVGFGRTDARPYFNLNFDPNDAVTFGVGHQEEGGYSYEVFVVADDRFHTGQRDWHLNAQIPFGESHATLDLLHKTGSSDAGPVSAWGFSANYDWPGWFLRVAYDPYQNFSTQSAWRFAGGVRF